MLSLWLVIVALLLMILDVFQCSERLCSTCMYFVHTLDSFLLLLSSVYICLCRPFSLNIGLVTYLGLLTYLVLLTRLVLLTYLALLTYLGLLTHLGLLTYLVLGLLTHLGLLTY